MTGDRVNDHWFEVVSFEGEDRKWEAGPFTTQQAALRSCRQLAGFQERKRFYVIECLTRNESFAVGMADEAGGGGDVQGR